jgi:HEAT repeat protein
VTQADPRANVTELERGRLDEVSRLSSAPSGGVNGLIALLEDPSWSVRRAVISALAELGEAAVAPLIRSLQDDRRDETRIAATVDTLVASAGDVERSLVVLAAAGDPAVAADVAQILGRRRNRSSLPTLIALLSHADDNVAVAAIEALGRVGGRAAVDALVAAVDRDYFFRTYPAIDVLGRSGDPRAVAPLARLVARQTGAQCSL